jgi:hypothetical protein
MERTLILAEIADVGWWNGFEPALPPCSCPGGRRTVGLGSGASGRPIVHFRLFSAVRPLAPKARSSLVGSRGGGGIDVHIRLAGWHWW